MRHDTPSDPRRSGQRWFHEPLMWMIVGLPIAAVIASAISVTLAFRHADEVLDQSMRSDESTIHQDANADAHAHQLHVQATLDQTSSQWIIHLDPGQAPLPDQLVVTLNDTKVAQNDQRLLFDRRLSHDYVGPKPKGLWNQVGDEETVSRILVEIAPLDRSWRLKARVTNDRVIFETP